MAGMKMLPRITLFVSGSIAAVLALWAAVGVFGIWFMVPVDHSLTQAQQMRVQLGYTALFVGAILLFGALSRLALKKAWNAPE
jgi:hypothetical protein